MLLRLAAVFLCASLAVGCAQASPRFGQDIQTALAREDMRRIETADMRLYYAERDEETARRMLSRFEGCVAELRLHGKIRNRASREKLVVVAPHLPFNNAYVAPATAGQEHVAVVPTFNTTDVFSMFGLSPDPSMIGCHEMAHYIQGRQLSGIPNFIEAVFGYTVSPETGLEPWFWEGLAVYYETKLQRGLGRLGSDFWSGVFAAGVGDEGLHESDLNESTRRIPFGGHYLVGSQFVDWLARTFGEDRLWDVIARQSDEVAIPLGVSGRFTNAFGRPLARLFSDFVADTRKRLPKRVRPANEGELRTLPQHARYAVSRDGTEAIFEQGVDTPARLRVVSPGGETLVERNLTDLLPGRALVAPDVLSSSGISFSGDGKKLYWVAVDQGENFNVNRLVCLDLGTQSLSVVVQDLGGAGGSIAPDGSRYYFARPRGDRWELAAHDLASGTSRTIADYGPRAYVLSPRVSPNGSKIALTLSSEEGMEILVVDSTTGAGTVLSRARSPERGRTEPSWIDDDELLYVADADGRAQVFRASSSTGQSRRVTDTPYLAFSPFVKDGHVRFLSRRGWHWTVNEVDIAASPESRFPETTSTETVASHARHAAGARPDLPLELASSTKYSHTDNLFVPTLRGPSVLAISGLSTTVGMGLSGGDRLGFHRWALSGSWDFVAAEPSVTASYINGQLAPVLVFASGERLATHENVLVPTGTGDMEQTFVRRETVALVGTQRTFWTTTVSTSFRYDELRSPALFTTSRLAAPILVERERRFAGPELDIRYAAAEATPNAGARRTLSIAATAGFFPALTTEATGDARLAIGVVRPLPLSRRHTLSFGLRGRVVPSAREAPLLQIGGNVSSTALASEISRSEAVGIRFQEPLRGFEDLGLLGSRALLGDITYRLPIIVDAGSISTISILPSLLFRQLDLEAFASGASLLDGRFASAAGGAAIARLKLWRLPLGFGLQVARRFTQDEGFNMMFLGGI